MENKKTSFSKGEVIFKKGEIGFWFYEIVSGSVKIYSDYGMDSERLLVEMKPGQTMGEMGLLSFRPRSATAVAGEDTETLIIDQDNFNSYMAADPARLTRMMLQLSERTRDLTKEYEEALYTVSSLRKEKKDSKLSRLIDKFAMMWWSANR